MPSSRAALQAVSRSVAASAAAAVTSRASAARMMASPTPETLHPTAALPEEAGVSVSVSDLLDPYMLDVQLWAGNFKETHLSHA